MDKPYAFISYCSEDINFILNIKREYRVIENSSHIEDEIQHVLNIEPLPEITLYHRIKSTTSVNSVLDSIGIIKEVLMLAVDASIETINPINEK